MKNYSSIFALLIAAAVGTPACVMDEAETVDEETVGSTEQAATESDFTAGTWTIGQGPQVLAYGGDYACFLTKVWGAFYGGGEWVEVYRGSDNYWRIAGGSQQGALRASATCVRYTAFTNVAKGYIASATAIASNNGYNVGPVSDMTWLSAMQGNFHGAGEYLDVAAQSWGAWWAQANHVSGTGVRGRVLTARLETPNYATRFVNYTLARSQMAPKDGHTLDNTDIDLGSAYDRVCYLTHIGGQFTGYGEWVEVKRQNGRWGLRAEADRWDSGVNATAQCVSLY
jgi:hypothetical protein